MTLPIPPSAARFLARFDRNGTEAFCVGGCVRDCLLGTVPHDWDVCTEALPEETMALFSDCTCIPTGLAHGTVTVLFEGLPIETTTYRVDGRYTDHRRPSSVAFTRSLAEDCARRDFTVNAMAYHPKTGLRDFFGGREDLADRIIRCVGNPETRFTEDALRMLRALRFASVLDFRIDPDTARAVRTCAPLLAGIAKERIGAELRRAVTGIRAAELLCAFPCIFESVLPCCTALRHSDRTERLKHAFAALPGDAPSAEALRIAALFAVSGCTKEEAQAQLTACSFEKKQALAVGQLVSCQASGIPRTERDMRYFLAHCQTPDTARQALSLLAALTPGRREDLRHAEQLLSEVLLRGDAYRLPMLAVTGADLLSCGLHGKAVGAALAELLSAVMDGRLPNEKSALLAALSAKQT